MAPDDFWHVKLCPAIIQCGCVPGEQAAILLSCVLLLLHNMWSNICEESKGIHFQPALSAHVLTDVGLTGDTVSVVGFGGKNEET